MCNVCIICDCFIFSVITVLSYYVSIVGKPLLLILIFVSMSKRYPITNPNDFPCDADVKLNGTAGTGKSTEAQERLMQTMEEKNLSYFDVTVSTYRNSLAREQVDNLKQHNIIPNNVSYSDTFIGTIHGICRRLINREDDVDITVQNNIVSSYHKHVFCKQLNVDYYSDGFEKSAGEELFDVISYMLHNNQSPETLPDSQLSSWRDKWGQHASLRSVVDKWEEFKDNPPDEVNADILWQFDELLLIVREAELIPPNEVLVIDELHDVYPLLNDVIQMWISETKKSDDKTVIVAGDPFQVINNYQGASPEFYENTDIPELVLNTTYRCPEKIWNYAQSVLHSEFIDIQDVSASDSGGSIKEVTSATFDYKNMLNKWVMANDTKWTPEHIATEHTDIPNNNDVMLLARTRVQLKAIAKQLDEHGIIYAGQMNSSWSGKENIDLLRVYNALQTLNNVTIPDEASEDEYLVDFEDSFVYDFDESVEITNPQLKTLIKYIPDKYIRGMENEKRSIIDSQKPYSFPLRETYFAFYNTLFRKPLRELVNEMDFSELQTDKLHKALSRYDSKVEQYNLPVQLRTIHESKGMQAHTVALYDGITANIEESLKTTEGRRNECRTWFVGASRSSQNLLLLREGFSSFEESPYIPLHKPDTSETI